MLSLFRKKAKNVYIDANARTASNQKNTVIRKKSIFQFIISESLCIIFIFTLIFCIFHIHRYITTSSFFNIREIKIIGAEQLSYADITNKINIHPGMNSLSVSISEIEKSLYENPWIYSVSVKRHLPDVFEIRIKEKKASFWIRKKDELYYADINGNIIAPVKMEHFISLPTLEVSSDGEALRATIGQLLQTFQETKLPIDTKMISHIRLSQAKGVEIIVGDQQLTLVVQPQDWKMNLLKLNAVLHNLASLGELKATREIWVSGGSAWAVKKTLPTQ